MKALLVLSNDIEDVEALATRALLIRSGFDVTTVSTEETLMIRTAFGLNFQADKLLSSVLINDYELLIIPGGKYVANTINRNQVIPQLAKAFATNDKLIAAICAGPRFLGKAGLLDHKRFTAYPGSEVDMPKGIYCPESKVMTDGNIITGKGAGTVYQFVYEIVKYYKGTTTAEKLFESIQY